jgi:anti-sigma B factor antagonist
MNIDFTLSRGVTLATVLDSRLDAAGAPDFKTRVGDRLAAGSSSLVLDLSAVEFVDSTGLSAILSAYRRLPADGRGLALAGCRKPVTELIKLTRLDRVLRLFATAEGAVEALAYGAP